MSRRSVPWQGARCHRRPDACHDSVARLRSASALCLFVGPARPVTTPPYLDCAVTPHMFKHPIFGQHSHFAPGMACSGSRRDRFGPRRPISAPASWLSLELALSSLRVFKSLMQAHAGPIFARAVYPEVLQRGRVRGERGGPADFGR